MSILTSIRSAYTFEASGAMGNDDSGNGNTLSLTGSVPQVAGKTGASAASWTDSGGFSPAGLLSGNYNRIAFGTDFSVALWVQCFSGTWNSTPYDMFICGCMGAGTDQWAIGLQQSTRQFYFQVSGGGAGGPIVADGQAAINFSQWYFLYAEWEYNIAGSTMRFRRDNLTLQTGSPGFASPYGGSPAPFTIGSNGHGAGFTMDGYTDGLAIWDRKLTSGEQSQLLTSFTEYPYAFERRRSGIWAMT